MRLLDSQGYYGAIRETWSSRFEKMHYSFLLRVIYIWLTVTRFLTYLTRDSPRYGHALLSISHYLARQITIFNATSSSRRDGGEKGFESKPFFLQKKRIKEKEQNGNKLKQE